MKGMTKFALGAGAALALGLAGVVSAHPEGGWGGGYGMGPGHMGPGSMHGGGGYGMGSGMGPGFGMGFGMHGDPAFVKQRLDTLKTTLGITDKQDEAWNGFAATVEKQAGNRGAWFEKMHDATAAANTVDARARHDEAMKQHQADAESVTAALRRLYEVLTPDQRAKLDGGLLAQGPGRRGRF